MANDRKLDLRYRPFPVRDMGVPTREVMADVLSTLRAELDEGRAVYVHCWGGIGRTGTVAGCWLVEEGHSAAEALARIAALRQGCRAATPVTRDRRAVRLIRAWVLACPRLRIRRDRVNSASARSADSRLGTRWARSRVPAAPFTDFVWSGARSAEEGQWTMTSRWRVPRRDLVERGFDPADQQHARIGWSAGTLSSTGRALHRQHRTRRPSFERKGPSLRNDARTSAGNGSTASGACPDSLCRRSRDACESRPQLARRTHIPRRSMAVASRGRDRRRPRRRPRNRS